MHGINHKAAAILEQMTENLDVDNPLRTIGTLSVRYQSSSPDGDLISVGCYYTQNGVLMRDPEMVFIRAVGNEVKNGKHHPTQVTMFYPVSHRVDSLGIYKECAFFDESGCLSTFDRREQLKQAKLANMWMSDLDQEFQRTRESEEITK